MDQLNQVLAGLGPWGMLIGVGLTLLVNYLRTRQVLPSAPVAPTPANPTPSAPDAVPVLPVIPNRPVLNLGLQLLQVLAQKRLVQAQSPVAPYAAAVYDPHQALEDDVLKRVAAEIGAQTK